GRRVRRGDRADVLQGHPAAWVLRADLRSAPAHDPAAFAPAMDLAGQPHGTDRGRLSPDRGAAFVPDWGRLCLSGRRPAATIRRGDLYRQSSRGSDPTRT